MYTRKVLVRRRALAGVQSHPPLPRLSRRYAPTPPTLGSLGDDGNTLSTPTINDTVFQTEVLNQLREGVKTLKTEELQRWLQVAATLAIPLTAAIWKMIFNKGAAAIDSV